MKIVALVENTSNCELRAKHGLSLYVETPKHKLLFDVGPDSTLFENSKKLGIDLSEIDTVIISHGHCDHGGAIKQFLEINKNATVYIQRSAFYKHYSKVAFLKVDIGLDKGLTNHPQVKLLDGDYCIDSELSLFTVDSSAKCYSTVNDSLYCGREKDKFKHEQNLIIMGSVLIMGCGHMGVVNIVDAVKGDGIKVCIGGFHLFSYTSKKTVGEELLDEIACELNKRDIKYYTCHCTGQVAFDHLQARVTTLQYLSVGEKIEV